MPKCRESLPRRRGSPRSRQLCLGKLEDSEDRNSGLPRRSVARLGGGRLHLSVPAMV